MNQIVDIPTIAAEARVLDSKQTAELLGLSVCHLRRLYRSGKVPKPMRIGARNYGWRTGTLIAFIAAKAHENVVDDAAQGAPHP